MKLLLRLSDIPPAQQILIYGSGQAGDKFRQVLERFRPDLSFVGYLDSFNPGTKDDVPIYKFADLGSEFLRNCQVLVVSSFWRDIEVALARRTSNYLVVPSRFYQPDILNILARHAEPSDADLFYQYFDGNEWGQQGSLLNDVLSLFETESDRYLYRLLTAAFSNQRPLLEGISEYFYQGGFGRQYFEFLNFPLINTILEGGVFNGYDTLEFLKQTDFTAEIHGFEPDIDSYRNGVFISNLREYSQVQIRPLGLWNAHKNLLLNPCPASSQLIAAGGEEMAHGLLEVEVIDIDNFVAEHRINKVDLIKMDIEGAEMEALQGAEKVIAEHQPQLAICIYHKKEHFIDIPLYLKQLNPDYRFRLGHYNADHTETVLYALVD